MCETSVGESKRRLKKNLLFSKFRVTAETTSNRLKIAPKWKTVGRGTSLTLVYSTFFHLKPLSKKKAWIVNALNGPLV